MDMKIRPLLAEEQKYTYGQSSQLTSQTGTIGYLRGDFDRDGDGFYSTWFDEVESRKTDIFKDELDKVINAMRFDGQYGPVLAGRKEMQDYVRSYPDSAFQGNCTTEYGFRIDTADYAYLLRCNPQKGDYSFYCYCYESQWLDRHLQNARKGIRFITPDYKEKFRISDGDRVRITMFNGETRDSVCRYQKDVRIFDKVVDENGDERRVLNKKETAIAQDRQELIKAKFAEWIWKDIDRRERLCRIYNETFNSIRPREYDGQHIRFSGMNPEITLRPHQINAIAHIMYGGNTLLAHEVGAGKTFEMVAAAMESKRLGLCTKSLVVVPNHITEQWAAEWLQLYPSANILVATKKDFERQNRRKFCGRIATGDYDAIIIGHSQFEKIPISRERQEAMLQKQIREILAAIREAKEAKAERYTVKQMEKTRKSLEARLKKLNDQSRKDDVVAFEELTQT